MTTKNKRIRYGKFELDPEEFNPRFVKERVTMFVDQDIVDHFRAAAKKKSSKYQTLMNQALREQMEKTTVEQRLESIEKKLNKLIP